MFNKIMVCVDPYPPGDNLLCGVIPLKQCGVKEIILAYILNADTPQALEGMVLAQALPEMERQQKLLEEAGFVVTLAMPRGVPAQALHDLAETEEVSLIVIGTHGRGITTTLALGSVSAKLLHLTRRPVLLSRAGMAEKATHDCQALFSHLLFPTDFSDPAEIAFAYLESLIRARNCRVTLLHVQDGARPAPHLGHRLPPLRDPDTARLQRLQLWLERAGATQVEVELVQGNPGDEVVNIAKSKGCSLILMGTQGKGITRELLLGSVAHQVVRHAEQPILLIPALPQVLTEDGADLGAASQ
jgi:nucleotide-binding universal stress UspA family protein